MRILIINGPNLNFLGKRNPEIYGGETLTQINSDIQNSFSKDEIEFFQSNHEGSIIDKIQASHGYIDGMVINPGAYAHYSYAIHDALESCPVPIIEVHLSNIYERESFRKTSVTAPACDKVISGQGKKGYMLAIEQLKLLQSNRSE
jgi:3-dehydroquinate dehydratase-2